MFHSIPDPSLPTLECHLTRTALVFEHMECPGEQEWRIAGNIG